MNSEFKERNSREVADVTPSSVWVRRARFMMHSLAVISTLSACAATDSARPLDLLPPAFVTSYSPVEIGVISVRADSAEQRRVGLAANMDMMWRSPNGGGALISLFDPHGACAGSRLVQFFDFRTQRALFRASFGRPCFGFYHTGLELARGDVMAASDGGDVVFVWGLKQGQNTGLAALDSRTFTVLALDSLWKEIRSFPALVLLPPTTHASQSYLAVLGTREGDSRSLAEVPVRLLDPSSLLVIDSIPRSAMPRSQQIWNLMPCANSALLLIEGELDLVLFDRVAKQTVGSIQRPAFGLVSANAGCETVVSADVGGDAFAEDASGMIWVFRNLLARVDSVDISSPLGLTPWSSAAIRSGGSVVSDDGRSAWVRVGYDGQRVSGLRQLARLIQVDLLTGQLRRNLLLGGESGGILWPVPE